MQNPVSFNTPQAPSTPDSSAGASFLKGSFLPALIIVAVILGGVGTGWYMSKGSHGGVLSENVAVAPGVEVKQGGKEVGLDDSKTFRDKAEGKLVKGGIDDEGTHHLERDGGPNQNVYLTSSVIDLDQFIDKKVEVWGETQQGQKAGWLMDVGRVKVLE